MLVFNHTTGEFENKLSDTPEIKVTLSQILGFVECVFPKELILKETRHFSSQNGHNFPKDCETRRLMERTVSCSNTNALVRTRRF